MSEEKENLKKLVERVDELLVVLNKISEDLRSVSSSIKSAIGLQVAKQSPQAIEAISGEIHGEKKTVDDVRLAFSEDLEVLLGFEEKNDYIMVKPKQFLGSENFAKIASTVRGLGGEYISAGKDSHFRVPKKA